MHLPEIWPTQGLSVYITAHDPGYPMPSSVNVGCSNINHQKRTRRPQYYPLPKVPSRQPLEGGLQVKLGYSSAPLEGMSASAGCHSPVAVTALFVESHVTTGIAKRL